MNFDLDHVGIAVRNLEESVAFYRTVLGLQIISEESVEGQNVQVAVISATNNQDGAKLELLEPISDLSPVAKFLARRGPGFHHLAFRVDNLDKAMRHLQQQGLEIIGEPQSGAGNCRFIFVHPRSTGGILIEVLQRF